VAPQLRTVESLSYNYSETFFTWSRGDCCTWNRQPRLQKANSNKQQQQQQQQQQRKKTYNNVKRGNKQQQH
jgi:uncharacterized protein YlxW (UPF0749 family)